MKQLLLGLKALIGPGCSFLSRPAGMAVLWISACGLLVLYSLQQPGNGGFISALGLLLVALVALFLKLRFHNFRFPNFLGGLVRLVSLLLLSVLAGSILYLSFVMPKDYLDLRFHVLFHFMATVAVTFGLTIAIAWVARGPFWLFTKNSNRFLGWATLTVFSVVVLYYSAEKWRGKRLWAAAQKEMVARGEKPGLDSLTPPPVPENQDAAKAPILAPLSNYTKATDGTVVYKDKEAYKRLESIQLPSSEPFWYSQPDWLQQKRTDLAAIIEKMRTKTSSYHFNPPTNLPPEAALLEYLGKYDTDLEAIRLASQRPYARFKLIYKDGSLAQSHILFFQNVANVFDDRALAYLKTGHTNEAFEDVRCALRLSHLQFQQDSMIDSLSAVRMTLRALQPIWEGMASGQWSEAQLSLLQMDLDKIKPLTDFHHWAKTQFWLYMDVINQTIPIDNYSSTHRFFQMNEKGAAYFLTAIRMVYPKGWSYQDQADLYFQYRSMLEIVDISQQRIYVKQAEKFPISTSSDLFYLGFVMPKMRELREGGFPRMTATAQTGLNLAKVACALERYRIARGNYPKATDELVPQFMDKLPHDILNGEPLHYDLDTNGHYALYSVGWNLTDDKGITVTDKDGVDQDQGDWVWEFPRHEK